MSEQTWLDSAWISVHAFYQDDLDLLLTAVVAPLVDELAADGMAQNAFFLRYWDGGPHLRLRVRPADGADRVEVRRLIGDRFVDYLSHWPSADRISALEYAGVAPRLALGENLRSWEPLPYPNNTIAFLPYRREHDRFGYGTSMEAAERHFVESSRIALRVVLQAVPRGQRAAVATTLTLIAWFVGDRDPRRLAAWLAERQRATGASDQPASPADVDGRDRMIGLARRAQVLAETAAELSDEGTLVDWARSMLRLRAALSAQVAVDTRAVLDRCAHLICNRLGLPPATEATLRRQAAEAVAVLADER